MVRKHFHTLPALTLTCWSLFCLLEQHDASFACFPVTVSALQSPSFIISCFRACFCSFFSHSLCSIVSGPPNFVFSAVYFWTVESLVVRKGAHYPLCELKTNLGPIEWSSLKAILSFINFSNLVTTGIVLYLVQYSIY